MVSVARKLGKLPFLIVSWVEEKRSCKKHVPMRHFFMRKKNLNPKNPPCCITCHCITLLGAKLPHKKIPCRSWCFFWGAISFVCWFFFTGMQENLSLGDAAKRLLTVTCDACVSALDL